jgi:hypothetical protein
MQRNYVLGAGGGLISAIMFGTAAAATPLAGILFYIAPLPLCIASLGFSPRSGLVGAAAGALLLGLAFAPALSLVFILLIGLPIPLFCHLILLSRPTAAAAGVPSSVEWYPPGRLVGWAAVVAGCLAMLLVLTLGYDQDSVRDSIRTMLHSPAFQSIDQDGLFTDANIEQLSGLLARALPAAFAIVWLSIALFNLWLSGVIMQAAGHSPRPWPALNGLEIPNGFFLGFVAALIASFLPGIAGLIATGFAGALLIAFVLQGLAVIHTATRGMAWRGLLLAAVYAGILLLGWVGIIVAILGIAEPMLNLRGRAARNGNTPD